jgi:hypothetical protein
VTDLTPIAPRLADLIRRLASDHDGEVVAAWRAMIRTLKGIGADLHDVAEYIEHFGNGALSEREMLEIFDAGVKTGIEQAEQRLHNNLGVTAQFPSARDMAMHCYQRIDQLNEWEQEFITNMVSWTRRKPLSVKQQARLEEVYLKLGGRI